jgi:hypothetical protein
MANASAQYEPLCLAAQTAAVHFFGLCEPFWRSAEGIRKHPQIFAVGQRQSRIAAPSGLCLTAEIARARIGLPPRFARNLFRVSHG